MLNNKTCNNKHSLLPNPHILQYRNIKLLQLQITLSGLEYSINKRVQIAILNLLKFVKNENSKNF